MDAKSINPQQVAELAKRSGTIDLIDVRTPAEYARVHAQGARSIPLDDLTPTAVAATRPADATGPTYVICQSGGRSKQACAQLGRAGVDVVNVTGGTTAWEAAGLAVEPSSDKCRSSRLPGTVRALGLLAVLVTVLLGLFYQPWFAYVGMGIWLVMLVAGRGACPLGACSVRPRT